MHMAANELAIATNLLDTRSEPNPVCRCIFFSEQLTQTKQCENKQIFDNKTQQVPFENREFYSL